MWSNPHWRRVHTTQGKAQRGRWSLLSPGVYLELFSPAQSDTVVYLIIWKVLWSSEHNWSFHAGLQRDLFMALPIISWELHRSLNGNARKEHHGFTKTETMRKMHIKVDRITKWMRAGRAAGIKELGVRKAFDKVPLKILFPIGSDINTVTGTVWRAANME